jgi:hypothetical protein
MQGLLGKPAVTAPKLGKAVLKKGIAAEPVEEC